MAYIRCSGGKEPSGTKSIIANGQYNVVDYAEADVNVPNTNTTTYTYPSGSTGGTVDMGATNDKRYVNAQNVYSKGVLDGRTLTSQRRTTKGGSPGVTVTFSFPNKIVGITNVSVDQQGSQEYANVFHYVRITGNNTVTINAALNGNTSNFVIDAVGY